jgi:hypothetical protein
MFYRIATLLIVTLTGIGIVVGAAAQAPTITLYVPLITSGLRQTGAATNLHVEAATHLGGAQADQATAVDIAADGTIVLGGILPGYTPSAHVTTLLNGTSGALARFDRTGQALISFTQIGASVNDLEIGSEGVIVACGDFGIAALDATASDLLWSAAPGAGKRCALGADGTAAVLAGNVIYAYDRAGALLGSWTVAGSAVNDIAVDGANQLVIATGFTQVSGNLQHPFIRGYTYAGGLRWRSYDFPSQVDRLTADTRGERIAIGRDGKLYFTGSINGGTGVSVLSRDPQDSGRSANDRTVQTDTYTRPTNVGSVKMLWFGRFNPADGALELGQSVLTRLSSGRGNSIGAQAITADADGTVYIGGAASAAIANRDKVTISGAPIGPYGATDAYVLVVSPDFTQRKHWVAFAGPSGGRGGVSGVAVRNGMAALAATLSEGAFITRNALQPGPAGGTDAYLAVWEH